jgi:Protein of unknown function (DUF2752)
MEIDICPRWLLVKLRIPEGNQHHIALFLSTLVALALLPLLIHIPHFCLMQKVFGVPCLGCGISHSIIAMLRLNPVMAWRANPAGIGVALTFCFQLVARPIAIMIPAIGDAVSHASRFIGKAVLGSLMAVWIFRVI